jgi:hypothetical protein
LRDSVQYPAGYAAAEKRIIEEKETYGNCKQVEERIVAGQRDQSLK